MALKKTVAFLNLGCKVNSYETEAMEERFKEADYEIKGFHERADVYVVNTCTVTNMADRKSRQMLHRAKKINPDAVVVAVGCYVQAPQSKLEEDPLVDILVGTREKALVHEKVEEYLKSGKTKDLKHDVLKSGDKNKEWIYDSDEVYGAGDKTRANLKIQDGCNQFCTFCIIPYVRGRIRSREEDSVLAEAKRLVERGFKEIVLTGIHIGSYGKDVTGKEELLGLLEKLDALEGDFRIRLGSVEPRLISEDFAREVSGLKKVCPHFHLSLQSGSNGVLKRMNRHYTTEEYLNSVQLLKKYYDRPAITTDIIVGFPGETEEEFLETMDFVQKVGFLKVHVFPYSKRSGTYAAKMEGQVADPIKKKRSELLIKKAALVSKQYLEGLRGLSLRVLPEEGTGEGREVLLSHSDSFVEVRLPKHLLPLDAGSVKGFLTVKEFTLYSEENSDNWQLEAKLLENTKVLY